jgi:hypothetical protein
MADQKKEFDWFDHPSSRKLLWWVLWIICGLTLVAELFLHRHAYFSIDGWFGFYTALGFVGCALMILTAKGLGLLLKRKENYYGDTDEENVTPEDNNDGHSD